MVLGGGVVFKPLNLSPLCVFKCSLKNEEQVGGQDRMMVLGGGEGGRGSAVMSCYDSLSGQSPAVHCVAIGGNRYSVSSLEGLPLAFLA